MSVGFGVVEADQTHRQIETLRRRLQHPDGGDGRRNSHRQRSDAADAGFDAKVVVTVLRGRRRVSAKAAVADNHTRLGGGFGSGLRTDKTRDQSGKCHRVSGNERDNALPQWPLREDLAHDPVSPPLDRYKQLTGKEIPPPVGKGSPNCAETAFDAELRVVGL